MKSLFALLLLLLTLLPLHCFMQRSSIESRTLQLGKSPIDVLLFTPDSGHIIMSSDANVASWNLKTGKSVWQTSLESRSGEERTISNVINLALSLDGQTIAVSYWQSRVVGQRLLKGDENRIAIIDSHTGGIKFDFRVPEQVRHSTAFSPSIDLAVSSQDENCLYIWNLEQKKSVLTIDTPGKPLFPLFSPDGNWLAVAVETPHLPRPGEPPVVIYDVKTGAVLHRLPRQRRNSAILRFAPDGKFLAVVSDDLSGAQIDLWNLASKQRITFTDHQGGITALAFSPNGRFLASGDLRGASGHVVVRNLAALATPKKYKFKSGVSSLAYSADNNLLAVGTDSGQVKILNLVP